MNDLNAAVLVLNKGYTPIHIKCVADAVCDAMSEGAFFIEHERFLVNGDPNPFYYQSYTWQQWMDQPITSKLNAQGIEEYYVNVARDEYGKPDTRSPAYVLAKRTIRTNRRVIRAPFVMAQRKYNMLPDLDIRRNRKNIWLRDGCKCQYCGHAVTLQGMTYDHVKPKASKGGESWTNLVCACQTCNLRKGNRTPEQAKMPLIGWTVPGPNGQPVMTYTPFKPKWYPLFSRFTSANHPEWDDFLPDAAKERPPLPPPALRKHA
jgi:5-methylcytosine-specific restriction endonuclease McrA